MPGDQIKVVSASGPKDKFRTAELRFDLGDDEMRVPVVIELRQLGKHATISVVKREADHRTPAVHLRSPLDEPLRVLLDEDDWYAFKLHVD